ncbi:MAG: cation-translocating P-type ATPase [Chloroflexi bacterium]|nr:cation-translocating P-type ATPase [Chloroflexota bacterium]
MSSAPWHALPPADVLRQVESDAAGLSETEAAARLARNGPNELIERGLTSPWRILWEQLTATMVVILIVAAAVSVFLGDEKDAIVIAAIVVLNAALGFAQEYRAERALAALKKLAAPVVKVRRDGILRERSARELVSGDVILLETGMLVPADCRVLESVNLRAQEATLTGESHPVDKFAEMAVPADASLGDRHTMAFMGTVVTYGRGAGIVVETGMNTVLGGIAAMLQDVSAEQTPLQRRLDQLGRALAGIALVIVAVVFVLGILRGEDARLMFLTAVSMAVAAVPEGLPAVVTIALALGAQRMLKRRALIRKLPAVETLGSVTVICSDKTGTLTENRMTVIVLDVAGARFDPGTAPGDSAGRPLAATLTLLGGALCNDAQLQADGANPQVIGDPTEGALLTAAYRMGMRKVELEQSLPRVAEIPFDSNRKRMTTVHTVGDRAALPGPLREGAPAHVALTKGAVDSLLAVCDRVWVGAEAAPLDEAHRLRIAHANDELAARGVRVIGVAVSPLDAFDPGAPAPVKAKLERNLVFAGLMGMIDPPRAEVRDAVHTCRAAGIRPVMITGDHPLTAQAIARALDIAGPDDDGILTGRDLDGMDAAALDLVVETVSVYARVSPEHKLAIVQALQNRGHVVAMTGDGVNDAPALKRAEIGVAMGITGTDVSKEAADMVLLDDNFATIVAAVEEGRTIYDNVRKFIRYLMASNSGEIWVMLAAPFIGMPLPLLPLQILWINLVTDGPPALALSVEPAERNAMRRPPNARSESFFGRGMGWHIIWVGLLMAGLSLGAGWAYWRAGRAEWQTMVFIVLTLAQMAHVLAIRTGRDSLFTAGVFSNMALISAIGLTFVLQLAVVYLPFMQEFFSTKPLAWPDLLIALALSSIIFWAVELEKWVQRRRTA